MGSHKRIRLAFLLIVCILMTALAGFVYAYLFTVSNTATNHFVPETEEDVTISNYAVNVPDAGYAVYVRAFIVITWKDNDGNVYGKRPVQNGDYSIMLNVGDGAKWFEKEGFYYYEESLSSGTTDQLITSVTQMNGADVPDGYSLHIEVIAQTIQALGTTDGNDPIPAVTDAWGVYVVDGKLSLTAPADP